MNSLFLLIVHANNVLEWEQINQGWI